MPTFITNKQGIIDFYDAFSRSDFDTIAEMLHPDCQFEFPGTYHPNVVRGKSAILALLAAMQANLNGSLRFHTKWAMFDGDMVAAHWYTTATTQHGGAYMNRGVAWFKLKDGLVHQFLDFLDTEIINAFWPQGQDATHFAEANRLVEVLRSYAPAAVNQYWLEQRQ
ncbi:nuclear transport factor 2 family protein [Ferrimonas senticii]|uniref:nuclear transport factor 2 family protein n=1 Tax=Ferrimonas senticii TaxID=394566 RepID=UPI00040FA628|nr:nuclear transport factor 2 family protein [Ferrimonas senticii]